MQLWLSKEGAVGPVGNNIRVGARAEGRTRCRATRQARQQARGLYIENAAFDFGEVRRGTDVWNDRCHFVFEAERRSEPSETTRGRVREKTVRDARQPNSTRREADIDLASNCLVSEFYPTFTRWSEFLSDAGKAGLAADLRHRCALFAVLDDESVRRVRELRCVYRLAPPSQRRYGKKL